MSQPRETSSACPAIPRIAVIGGGIAGLAAAHRVVELARAHRTEVDLRLFEAGPRLGGSIATERTDGFVIEAGPDSFLSEKPWALALCERLGVTDRLVGTREEFRRTYVVRRGRLYPLPDGFLLLAPTRLWPLATSGLFSWHGKLRMACDLILPRGTPQADESLRSFVTRRLGREALERVAQPLVGGIYTADADTLSLAATMPRFLEMERKHRSIILAMWRAQRRGAPGAGPKGGGSGARWSLFVSFDTGMQALVDLLAERLPADALLVGTPARRLVRHPDGRWRINDDFDCDAVVIAAPAYTAGRLLAPLDATLGQELDGIAYASSATLTLAYRRADIPRPLDSFGFVVPLIEGSGMVACTFSSLKYPGRAPAEFVLLRTFVGGAAQKEIFAQDDATIKASVRSNLRTLLGISAEPALTRLHRHKDAMPQYHVGHLDRIGRIQERLRALPGLYVAGSAYRGVGVPDCIHTGEQAAEAALKHVTAGAPTSSAS